MQQSWIKVALCAASLVHLTRCDCESYGLDFQNGGTYFQNSLSTDPFTALQEFEGCQNDTAMNVFVDPDGDQSQCSNTPLLPNDTPQLVTCADWPKDKLYNGEWSLLIISNNGNGTPIAYQRDFSLTVGPQQTVTAATPTITGGSAGTQTITGPAITQTVTVGLIQFTVTTRSTSSANTTTVVPASCSLQTTSSTTDTVATIVPSVLGSMNAVAASIINAAAQKRSEPTMRFQRAVLEGRAPDGDAKAHFVDARRTALAKLNKRAPDPRTVTSTPSPVYVTATTSVNGTTSTSDQFVLFNIITTTLTTTTTSTATITTTSSGAAASCTSSGGVLV